MSRSRRLFYSLLTTIFAVLLLLLSLEGWQQWQEYSSDMRIPQDAPGLKYELRPGPGLNSHGFREREFPLEKPAGIRRIAVLGDSVTHGAGVPDTRIYSRVLEDTLHSMGRNDLQTLNFSAFGYDIESIVALARYRISDWHPDLVVYGYYVNDQIPTRIVNIHNEPRWIGTETRFFTVLSPALDPLLHRWSALFRWQEGRVAAQALANLPKDLQQESRWDWYQQGFKELVQVCKDAKLPLLMYLIPPHEFVQPSMAACNQAAKAGPNFCEKNLDFLQKALGYAQEEHIPALDGGAAFRNGPVEDLHATPEDPHHPNAEGHRRLGAWLAPVVEGMLQ